MGARLSYRLAGAALLMAAASCAAIPAYVRPAVSWGLDPSVRIGGGPPLAESPCAVYQLERYVNEYGDGEATVFTSRDLAGPAREDRPRFARRHDYGPLLRDVIAVTPRFFLPAGAACPFTAGLQFENRLTPRNPRYRFILRLKDGVTGEERLRVTRELTPARPLPEGQAVALLLRDAAAEVGARREEFAAVVTAPPGVPDARALRLIYFDVDVAPGLGELAGRQVMLTSLLAAELGRTRRYEIVSAAVRDELLAISGGEPGCAAAECRLASLRRLPGLDAVLSVSVAPAGAGCALRLELRPVPDGLEGKTLEIPTGCSLGEVVQAVRAAAFALGPPIPAP